MLTVEQQLAQVLDATTRLPSETIALNDVSLFPPRTLNADIRANNAIPAFDNSAMDGFALRAIDTQSASPKNPLTLQVIADIPAGSAENPRIQAGQTARIMTGAALPTDADAVVPFEDTVGGLSDSLTIAQITHPVSPGVWVRKTGADAKVNDLVVPTGHVLGAAQIAAALAAGVTKALVSNRPKVAVISTGSELVTAGTTLMRGQIPDSNGALLAALCIENGAEVVLCTRVADNAKVLRELVNQLLAEHVVDVLIFSGGVSAGAYEVVRIAFADSLVFSKVAMQPGKPQAFGVLDDRVLAFGLPGNPVSSYLSFEIFVRPALLTMQGRADIRRPMLTLPVSSGWRTPPKRRQYLPAVIEKSDPDNWSVAPVSSGGSASHFAGALARAEAWVVVPAEVEQVQPGDRFPVMLV